MSAKLLYENELIGILGIGRDNGLTKREILHQFYQPTHSVVSEDLSSLVNEGKVIRGLFFLPIPFEGLVQPVRQKAKTVFYLEG